MYNLLLIMPLIIYSFFHFFSCQKLSQKDRKPEPELDLEDKMMTIFMTSRETASAGTIPA